MSDSPTRDEVRQMIEDAVDRRVEAAVTRGIDQWMLRYGLKPGHWVYLDAQYHRMLMRESAIRRTIIVAIVTAITTLTLWGGQHWIKQQFVNYEAKRMESQGKR